jgi:hypothetical protein
MIYDEGAPTGLHRGAHGIRRTTKGDKVPIASIGITEPASRNLAQKRATNFCARRV